MKSQGLRAWQVRVDESCSDHWMPAAVWEVQQHRLRDMQPQCQYLENPMLKLTCAVLGHWRTGREHSGVVGEILRSLLRDVGARSELKVKVEGGSSAHSAQ